MSPETVCSPPSRRKLESFVAGAGSASPPAGVIKQSLCSGEGFGGYNPTAAWTGRLRTRRPRFRSSVQVSEDIVHLYWCADCKTPGCQRRQVFKDVPFDDSSSDEPTIHFNFPAEFEMRCKTCGVTHKYRLQEIDDFKSKESIPVGFESAF